MKSFLNDPLLVKELRTRLRARTALIIQLLTVCALTAMAALTLVAGGTQQPAWEAGRSLLQMLLYVQTLLLVLIAPLVAASAISVEKEQKTFDSLMATPVTPRRVVLMKWISAMAVFAVLIAISLPFAATAYLLGGVSPGVLIIGWTYTALLTTAGGTMGIYWSSRFERSIASIPAAAVSTVLFTLILPVFFFHFPLVLSGISPLSFLNNLFDTGAMQLYHATIPSWPILFGVLITAAGAMIAATIQRLKFKEQRRYAWMRGFSFALWVLLAAGMLGSFSNDSFYTTVFPALICTQIVLGLLAPWIGASQPVIRSERGSSQSSPPSRFRLLPRILTGPVSYTLLLSGIAVLGLGGLVTGTSRAGVSPVSGSILFVSVLVIPATLALLAFRLSDRRSTPGRMIGLAIAWLVTLTLLFAPLIVFHISQTASSPSMVLWREGVSLLSPLTPLSVSNMQHGAYATAFSHVHRAFGDAGVWAVAPLFYAVLFGLLALPVYPSETRRRQQTDRDESTT